jgi:hypothetical protein
MTSTPAIELKTKVEINTPRIQGWRSRKSGFDFT